MRQTLFSFVIAALSVQQALSHPYGIRTSDDTLDTDTQVLNYALTLEHLENAFYSGGLAQFNDEDFQNAGLSGARARFLEVAVHEAAHVAILTAVLGDQATQPCTYSFPYYDVHSFAALSQVLEGVGASAYTGAAQYLASRLLLTAAASILSTEARHASWVASAVNKAAPWYAPFEIPLPSPVVLALAAPYITSCPSTNPTLVPDPLPVLTLLNAVPGQNAIVQLLEVLINLSVPTRYIVFYSALSVTFVPIDSIGQVAVPANMSGRVYAIATSSKTEVTDKTMLARPAVLLFD